MRIIGGKWRGKQLATPKDDRVRPTTDRVRENLFNILAHADWAPSLEGARVLELCAGTGALGLEAVSRGAGRACFIDADVASRALIRQNMEACGAFGATKLYSRPVENLRTLEPGAGGPFDLVFCDPPYGSGLGPLALSSAAAGGWLITGAICALELGAGEDPPEIEGFERLDIRQYGETRIAFLRWTQV